MFVEFVERDGSAAGLAAFGGGLFGGAQVFHVSRARLDGLADREGGGAARSSGRRAQAAGHGQAVPAFTIAAAWSSQG